jgi:Carboxypeptidase regulatory-like domain
VLLFGPLAALLPGPMLAQVLYGSLTGNVTDQSGAAVPAAKVEAVNTATGLTREGTVDDHGLYLLEDLPAGVYNVTISAPAVANTVESGVAVVENTVHRQLAEQGDVA